MIFTRLFQYLFYRPKGWQRTLRTQLRFFLRSTYTPDWPTLLMIEPTNLCNQHCPGCVSGSDMLTRPRGIMPVTVFSQAMTMLGPWIAYADLYCQGESFLNRHIYTFIRQAKWFDIFTRIDTNGMIIDPQAVLTSGVDQLNFHLSGTTQDTHAIYRRGGDLTLVLENIRQVVKARRLHAASRLQIRMGMIVFRQNEHQIPDFFSLATGLEVDEAYLLSGKIPNLDLQTMAPMLTTEPALQVYAEVPLARGVLQRKVKTRCSWPWHGTCIAWTGDVLPCCHDHHNAHLMGNIMAEDFKSIWNNSKYRALRRQILDDVDIPMCQECPGYGTGAAITALTKHY